MVKKSGKRALIIKKTFRKCTVFTYSTYLNFYSTLVGTRGNFTDTLETDRCERNREWGELVSFL